jgi:hypothetical protein
VPDTSTVFRLGARLAGLACLLALIAAPAAGAAPRFASPSGTGTACTQAQPCDIVTAVNGAVGGDDVTIGPGTYGSPTPLATPLEDEGESLAIHGQAGQPRPVIHTSAEYGIEIEGPASSVSDLEIQNASGRFGVYVNETVPAVVDHVYSHVSAPGAIACYPSGTLTDSVCWSSGANGIAATVIVAKSVTATLRNDTLVASGAGGEGVAVTSSTSSTMTVNLSNSIARGAGTDIFASTDSAPKTASIVNADHSNYASVKTLNGGGGSTISITPAGSGTNQLEAPLFVNPAAGDFDEQAGSAGTIDRGENSPLDGATDLDGNPREQAGLLGCGGSPPAGVADIGAYERAPVVPPCPPPPPPARPSLRVLKLKRETMKGRHRRLGSAKLAFTAAGASSFECRLRLLHRTDHARRVVRFRPCASPKAYRDLRHGAYVFEVRAIEATGERSLTASKKLKIRPPAR